MYPSDSKFTEEHLWIRLEENTAIIGVTSYIAEKLNNHGSIDIASVGEEKQQMDECGFLESGSLMLNFYCPMSGVIEEINDSLTIETIEDSPYEDGWIFKLTISDPSEYEDLLSSDEYQKYVETLD